MIVTPEDNAARPNPWLPEQKLRELTNAVRANVIVQRIWQTAFTEGERQQISADETMGPDIVDIWVKFKGVSPTRAVLELARGAIVDPAAKASQEWLPVQRTRTRAGRQRDAGSDSSCVASW